MHGVSPASASRPHHGQRCATLDVRRTAWRGHLRCVALLTPAAALLNYRYNQLQARFCNTFWTVYSASLPRPPSLGEVVTLPGDLMTAINPSVRLHCCGLRVLQARVEARVGCHLTLMHAVPCARHSAWMFRSQCSSVSSTCLTRWVLSAAAACESRAAAHIALTVHSVWWCPGSPSLSVQCGRRRWRCASTRRSPVGTTGASHSMCDASTPCRCTGTPRTRFLETTHLAGSMPL